MADRPPRMSGHTVGTRRATVVAGAVGLLGVVVEVFDFVGRLPDFPDSARPRGAELVGFYGIFAACALLTVVTVPIVLRRRRRWWLGLTAGVVQLTVAGAVDAGSSAGASGPVDTTSLPAIVLSVLAVVLWFRVR